MNNPSGCSFNCEDHVHFHTLFIVARLILLVKENLLDFFSENEEGTLKFDVLVWVEVCEMSPSGE